jgi:hypothetical protein
MATTLLEQLDKAADKANKAAGMDALARHAEAIRELLQRARCDIIKIGERLTAARKICGHGNWRPWLEHEFQWTDDTALNFTNVYKWYERDPERVRDLNLPLRGLYLLARPSTPEAIRQEVIEHVERGEKVSVAEVNETITKAKTKLVSSKPEAKPSYLPDDIIDQIIDLFKQLQHRDQAHCLRKQHAILQGRC